jgi:hypothetical protein
MCRCPLLKPCLPRRLAGSSSSSIPRTSINSSLLTTPSPPPQDPASEIPPTATTGPLEGRQDRQAPWNHRDGTINAASPMKPWITHGVSCENRCVLYSSMSRVSTSSRPHSAVQQCLRADIHTTDQLAFRLFHPNVLESSFGEDCKPPPARKHSIICGSSERRIGTTCAIATKDGCFRQHGRLLWRQRIRSTRRVVVG